MMIVLTFFAAATMLYCASAEIFITSLLLPAGIFANQSVPGPTFLGQVTVNTGVTYYTLDYYSRNDASVAIASGEGYAFSESSAGTQYLDDDSTIDCSPLGISSSATCTTTFTDGGSIDQVTNVESSLYTAVFTTAANYRAASNTTATPAAPSRTSSPPTARATSLVFYEPSPSATTDPTLGPSSKVGIGLGVPLGACAIACIAFLLYRHGKHKERSRMTQMGNLAPPQGPSVEPECKRFPDAELPDQTLERSPPVYSMELPG